MEEWRWHWCGLRFSQGSQPPSPPPTPHLRPACQTVILPVVYFCLAWLLGVSPSLLWPLRLWLTNVFCRGISHTLSVVCWPQIPPQPPNQNRLSFVTCSNFSANTGNGFLLQRSIFHLFVVSKHHRNFFCFYVLIVYLAPTLCITTAHYHNHTALHVQFQLPFHNPKFSHWMMLQVEGKLVWCSCI